MALHRTMNMHFNERMPAMIEFKSDIFYLNTENTSYWFRITGHKHLEHIHYGVRLSGSDVDSLLHKRSAIIGSTVDYGRHEDDNYSLDSLCLEWSGIGRGDYRISPAELRMPDGSFTSDFVYRSHRIAKGCVSMDALPSAYDDTSTAETLIVELQDESNALGLSLYYTVFEKTDVITRRAVLTNNSTQSTEIRKLMSMNLDMENRNFSMITFDGGWIKEAHRHDRKLQYGAFVNSSYTGASSNRHNPGFLLAEEGAGEEHGGVYGFNLIYSGNHSGAAELAFNDLVRVQIGINPQCFSWTLNAGESFETPEAIMTYSDRGFNGMSAHFHDFINAHIIRGDWKGQERPVLLNNWEAHFFKFNEGRLLRLARRAKKLGVELFVLDDGWFGNRNSDTAGLGDYSINRKKLPRGLKHFSEKLQNMGLRFGLWFEPEMVNTDSDLYRAHPEYAVTTPGKKPGFGRNQLVLDLCNPKVRDYIVQNVSHILDQNNISYVKWDMNRHISDAYSPCIENQGEFFHRYMIGLYDVLRRIFYERPHILFESCSSGGNRFDAGILCFCQQVWTSDDTDPIERLEIQSGISYLYPLSTIGAHVSSAPHQQTLRSTPLSTRFNVSSFGCLGYELDLKYLSYIERKELREQIAFYKAHRKTLQYGRFYRLPAYKANKRAWQCVSGDESIAGFFQTLTEASEGNDILPLRGLDALAKYSIKTKPQRIMIERFGGLVKHILPIELDPRGFILRTANKLYALNDCVEHYTASGRQLMSGVHLHNQFIGSGYNKDIRLLGDYGSSLYLISRLSI